MKNICIVTTARSDFGHLKPVAKAFLRISNVNILATGSHLQKSTETLNEVSYFCEKFNMKIYVIFEALRCRKDVFFLIYFL